MVYSSQHLLSAIGRDEPDGEQVIAPLLTHHRETLRHVLATRDLTHAVAREMGFDRVLAAKIATAGLLHDVGKLSVPREMLDAARRLTASEWETMRKHPGVSADIARRAGFDDDICRWIAAHHEREDGSGYPNGLRADAIDVPTRILIVADVWEATGSLRTYGGFLSRRDRIQALHRLNFPAVTNALFACIGVTSDSRAC